jgi:hypothetical protein
VTGNAWAWGAGLWLAYAAAHPWIHGIVLDDAVTSAQVLRGAIEYPAGHPNAVYHRTAYSLINYALAAAGSLTPSVAFASALMNILSVFSAVFASFALAAVLGGSALWGHLAACLTVAGAAHGLEGLYPLWTFPNFNASGQIGLHTGLIATALLLGRRWKSAGILFGLFPAVHGVLAAVFWVWGALALAWTARDPESRPGRGFWRAGAVGLAVSALLAWVALSRKLAPALAPYDVGSDGRLARDHFLRFLDVHRAPIPLPSVAYVLGPVLFFAFASLLRRMELGLSREPGARARPLDLVLLLGVLIWSFVLGTRAWQAAGFALPDVVLTAMPARLSNITAETIPALLAATIALAARRADGARRSGVLAIAAALLLALGGLLLARPKLEAALALPSCVGCALACTALASPRAWRASLALVAVLALSWWLASGATFGAQVLAGSWLAAGALGVVASRAMPSADRSWMPLVGCACAGLALCTAFAPTLKTGLGWARISDEDRRIERWLAEHASPEEALLAAMTPPSAFQLKTGHPVLFEMRTLWEMAYVPSLSAVTSSMAADLYGLDLAAADSASSLDASLGSKPGALWGSRTNAQWKQLSQRYAFRWVLAPSDLTRLGGRQLDLPVALADETWTLYRAP